MQSASGNLQARRAELAEAEAALVDTRAQLDARAAERVELQGAVAQLQRSKAELDAAVSALRQQEAAHTAARRSSVTTATQTVAGSAHAQASAACQAGASGVILCKDASAQVDTVVVHHAPASEPQAPTAATSPGDAPAEAQLRQSRHVYARSSSRASSMDAEAAALQEALSTAR